MTLSSDQPVTLLYDSLAQLYMYTFKSTMLRSHSRLVLLILDDRTPLSEHFQHVCSVPFYTFPMCNVNLKKKNVNLYCFKCFRTDVQCI